ncbi:MAG: YqgE/AlgH family protein [Mariniphaga sp.]
MEFEYDFFKIDKALAKPKKGKILISEPFLNDTYFKRSIVLLTEYSSEGSVGFVLNKHIQLSIDEVVKDFPALDSQVSIGGPVQTNTLHYIHTLGTIIPNSVHVFGDIYWGGDFDVIKEMVSLGAIPAGQIRFFLGYSGWMAKQLEGELERNSWVVTNIDPKKVMERDNSMFWKEILNNLGDKYRVWTNFPVNPTMN